MGALRQIVVAPQVNRSHPFANNLQFLFVAQPGIPQPPDVAKNRRLTTIVSGSAALDSGVFLGLKDPRIEYAGVTSALWPICMFALYKPSVVGLNWDSILDTNGNSATDGFILYQTTGNAAVPGMYAHAAGGSFDVTGATQTVGRWYSVAITKRASNDWVGAVRDQATGTTTVVTSSASNVTEQAAGTTVRVGNSNFAGEEMSGSVSMAGFTRSRLTNQQLIDWVLNPFGLLIPPDSGGIYRPPPAAVYYDQEGVKPWSSVWRPGRI
jgi:hypothetical protein